MNNQFSRTELLIGKEGVDKLYQSRVAVFGIGGVGGQAVEALARSGVGTFDLIDNDTISVTNINRQVIATHKNIGRNKVDVMKERILEINPDAIVHRYPCFYLPENAGVFDFKKYDYVIDALDTITAKIDIVLKATQAKVPVISSMGAGNKLDPTAFEIADIYKTSVCPLAKVMRKELKARGIKKLKVVYSKEKAMKPTGAMMEKEDNCMKRAIPGSMAYVPPAVGLIIASEVVKELIGKNEFNSSCR